MPEGHDSRAVANRILDIAAQKGLELTTMQLVKLVYIAHGWWLTFTGGKPLTSDSAEAWRYGPVYPNIYYAFKKFGSRPIPVKAIDASSGLEFSSAFSEQEDTLLGQIVDSYGNFHAYKLSDMTHKEGTPWDRASKSLGYYAPISNYSIQKHFDGLRAERAN